jgi:hypothetical protein
MAALAQHPHIMAYHGASVASMAAWHGERQHGMALALAWRQRNMA